MEKVPERVAYVSKECAKGLRIPAERMNCSPESLLLIWKWFRRRAKTERAIQPENKTEPVALWNKDRQLSLETEYILRDIGMYLGETFRKNNPQLYWTYYTEPRRDFFLNHPLLKGFVDRSFGDPFDPGFEPIHMSRIQALKVLDHSSKNDDLFNLYQLWVKKV